MTTHYTQRAYESDLRHFRAWGGTIPATALMVAEYLATYAGELACSTLERRLAAIVTAIAITAWTVPRARSWSRPPCAGSAARTDGRRTKLRRCSLTTRRQLSRHWAVVCAATAIGPCCSSDWPEPSGDPNWSRSSPTTWSGWRTRFPLWSVDSKRRPSNGVLGSQTSIRDKV